MSPLKDNELSWKTWSFYYAVKEGFGLLSKEWEFTHPSSHPAPDKKSEMKNENLSLSSTFIWLC